MAYLAPNEDTVVVVGGLGTQADKAQLNGGGATKAAWEAHNPGTFIHTNGGPKTTGVCAFTTATKNLAVAGIGLGVVVGSLCYVSTGDGTHIFAGIYEVTTVTDDNNIICAGIQDDGNNDTGVTVNIGGALDSLQNALDNPVNNVNREAGTSNRYIYDNIATETVSATVDVDTNSGSTNARVFVIGYNPTLAAKTEIIITTTSDITALILLDGVQMYYVFKSIDFDGGGKDASRALYCVSDALNASAYIVFEDCKFHGAESHGVEMDSDHWQFYNCEAYLNGGSGIFTGSNDGVYNKYISCSFHDNDSHGLWQDGSLPVIFGCLAYDNGKGGAGHGIVLESNVAVGGAVSCNTAHGNADSGFFIDSASLTGFHSIFNNTSVSNGAYGYDLDGTVRVAFFGYNHSYGNTTAHCSEVADGNFANFRNGNNQTGDPKFTNVADGSEDFTPLTGSDLIDNALGGGAIGAVEPAAGAAGAGGLMFSAGMTGGFND